MLLLINTTRLYPKIKRKYYNCSGCFLLKNQCLKGVRTLGERGLHLIQHAVKRKKHLEIHFVLSTVRFNISMNALTYMMSH